MKLNQSSPFPFGVKYQELCASVQLSQSTITNSFLTSAYTSNCRIFRKNILSAKSSYQFNLCCQVLVGPFVTCSSFLHRLYSDFITKLPGGGLFKNFHSSFSQKREKRPDFFFFGIKKKKIFQCCLQVDSFLVTFTGCI